MRSLRTGVDRLRMKGAALVLLAALLAGCGGTAATPANPPQAQEQAAEPAATAPATQAGAPAAGTATPGAASTMTTARTAATEGPPTATQRTASGTTTARTTAATDGTTTARTAGSTVRSTTGSTGANTSSDGPLTKNRLVTYYGHPYSDRMGILGEFDDPEAMIARLKQQTAAYTAADPSRPAICTVELIASVAQDRPGRDGLWLQRTPTEEIETYSQLAERHGCLLLLDIQMGYDSVANEVQVLLPFLRRPHVHLAIDPEFRMDPGEIPGEDYGSVSAADVNGAAKVLSELVTQHKIPDKVLVVHQFRYDMLPDKENIRTTPHVQLVVVMDGFGPPDTKTENYGLLVRDQPIQYGGIKLFYRQDTPLLTPEQILALDPVPLVVIYQ